MGRLPITRPTNLDWPSPRTISKKAPGSTASISRMSCLLCSPPSLPIVRHQTRSLTSSNNRGLRNMVALDPDFPSALPAKTPLQGGAYVVEGVIGQGGSGITYLSTDTG